MSVVRLYQFAPGNGYDPYNTATTHRKIAAGLIARDLDEARERLRKAREAEEARAVAEVDALIRRGFKALRNLAFGSFAKK